MELFKSRKYLLAAVTALTAACLLILAACSDGGSDAAGNSTPPSSEESGSDEEGAASTGETADSGESQETNDSSSEDSATVGDNSSDSPEPEDNAEADLAGKSIVVCLEGNAPELLLFGNDAPAAVALRHALSENLLTSVGYAYQAQGLEKLPNLADGDARRRSVTVNEGDRVVDATGKVQTLRKGVTVQNTNGEVVEFNGEAVEMAQLEVDFTFKPLVWSDGTPMSSLDSVLGFNVASDPHTAAGKVKTGFTQSYQALDDLRVRWTGLPGFMDPTYFTNVWAPLPAHILSRYTASELTTQDEVVRQPLSSGPYVIEEWLDENTIALSANPYYYRAEEGLPLIHNLIIKFGAVEALLADADCDVIADGALGSHNLVDFERGGFLEGWDLLVSSDNVYQQIAYGVLPVSEYRESRPDWFGDARVRQALAMCTDRERMLDEVTGGKGQILETLTSSDHPLAPGDLNSWAYDPAAANALLDEAGYLDFAGDGRRQDVTSGVPMTVTLGTNNEDRLRMRITEIFAENMAECGIPVVRYDRPAGTWFSPGPEGPLFGRKFDLAALAWLSQVIPDCTIFTTENIPGPQEFDFGGWDAPNVSGWSDEAYDAACLTAVRALPGGDGYEENMREALRIFNEQLPSLPLFTGYKVVAVRLGVENVKPDPNQASSLWNIAEWDLTE
jgi:peptide/nickel transport system substrate-binding protein